MRERRRNLHSIISKISSNVDVEPSSIQVPDDSQNTQNHSDDKTFSNMKIIGEHNQPKTLQMTRFQDQIPAQIKHHTTMNQANVQLCDPMASPPFICDLCSVAFLTKRELTLHLMCHGIHVATNVGGEKAKPVRFVRDPREIGVDEPHSVINQDLPVSERENGKANPDHVVVNSELKVVDVLSLATATRGFKEPGSIWCSLCKCSVPRGHTCNVYQTSYHAEKKEEGYTCELCGRFYNQKRKLRTHLRNRHKGFRLQEDEGYMCWQCWQAFPEIKILEEHIVQVHGQDSRRQNSTWRPFTQPSALPLDDMDGEGESPELSPIPVENRRTSSESDVVQSLKRGNSGVHYEDGSPGKKPCPSTGNGIINVAEVNGKIVVTNSPLPVKATHYPQANNVNPLGTNDSLPVAAVKPTQKDLSSLTTLVYGNDGKEVDNGVTEFGQNVPAVNTSSTADISKNVEGCSSKVFCPVCGLSFSNKAILDFHISDMHDKTLRCFYCSAPCDNKDILSLHIKTVHTEEMKSGRCPVCQCKCLTELHQHIAQYHGKDFLSRNSPENVLSTCPICNVTTTDYYHLRWHILREHRGHELAKELPDGLREETCSDSGSCESNEGSQMINGNVGKGLSGNNGEHGLNEESTSGLEIVFVSDKNGKSEEIKKCAGKSLTNGVLSNHAVNSDLSKPLTNGIHAVSDASHDWPINGNDAKHESAVNHVTADVQSVKENGETSNDKHGYDSIDRDTTAVENETKTTEHDCESMNIDICIFCFKTVSKDSLTSHLQADHGLVNVYNCSLCSITAKNYVEIFQHFCLMHFHPTDSCTNDVIPKCQKCDITFQNVDHLKKHASALHSYQISRKDAAGETFKCRHCNIVFEKEIDAQKHFNVYHLHRVRFKCESCRMGFTTRHDFQEHVACNHPELVKSFCPVCGLGFEVRSDLDEHVSEMHRSKAKYLCAECGNEFADRFHVHLHIRSNCCVAWADRNFECLDCSTNFSSISELRIHCKVSECKQTIIKN